MMDKKLQLRRMILEKRRSLTTDEIAAGSQIIADLFVSWKSYLDSQIIMLFLSMPDEPQTELLILDALERGKRVCVPLLGAKFGFMSAAEIHNLDDLTAGRLGLKMPDPAKAEILAPADIDLVIVPAVVFDQSGNRIGMGAGYYDRFLPQATNSKFLGLAWDFQVVDALPHEPHDIPVQYLLTEKGFRYV